eukprot:GILK01002152.1.p1 GENE.GILK01002152.1~~GILK01002152.1.p1  ORF type:complete len:359 (+),score=58.26 GILK01002152.1:68-1078(+)
MSSDETLVLETLRAHPDKPLDRWPTLKEMIEDPQGEIVYQDVKNHTHALLSRANFRGFHRLMECIFQKYGQTRSEDAKQARRDDIIDVPNPKRQKMESFDSLEAVVTKLDQRFQWFEAHQQVLLQTELLKKEQEQLKLDKERWNAEQLERIEQFRLDKERWNAVQRERSEQLRLDKEELQQEAGSKKACAQQLDQVYVKCLEGLDSRDRLKEEIQRLDETVKCLKDHRDQLKQDIDERHGALSLEEMVNQNELTLLGLQEEQRVISTRLKGVQIFAQQAKMTVAQLVAGDCTWTRMKSVLDDYAQGLETLAAPFGLASHQSTEPEAVCSADSLIEF